MADVFSREQRSRLMARVKGRDNAATELRLIAIFRSAKITGWRRRSSLFGKPDFVFPKSRVVVFVDGCFWHRCPRHGTIPASNKAFWKAKLERNIRRDKLVNRTLKAAGWRIVRVWQHELRDERRVLRRVSKALS